MNELNYEEKILQLEAELKKVKAEKLELEKIQKVNRKPWNVRRDKLEVQLKELGVNWRDLSAVKNSIYTIIIKTLHKKTVLEMNQEEIDKIEPFIQYVLSMFKENQTCGEVK